MKNFLKRVYYSMILSLFFDKGKYRYSPSPIGKFMLTIIPNICTVWQNGVELCGLKYNYYWMKCTRDGKNEPLLEKVLVSVLRDDEVVIDAGAQVGIVSVICSKLVGDTGRVFSFEPHPDNFRVLNEVIALNDCANIKAFNQGLSSKKGQLFFWEAISSGYSMLPDNKDDWPVDKDKIFEVSCNSIDSFISDIKLDHVDFLKIDVDGNDLDVLTSAQSLLMHETPPFIVFESSYHWKRFGVDLADALAILWDNNYRIYVSTISGNKMYHVPYGTVFQNGWGSEIGKAINVFAVKNQKHIDRLSYFIESSIDVSNLLSK